MGARRAVGILSATRELERICGEGEGGASGGCASEGGCASLEGGGSASSEGGVSAPDGVLEKRDTAGGGAEAGAGEETQRALAELDALDVDQVDVDAADLDLDMDDDDDGDGDVPMPDAPRLPAPASFTAVLSTSWIVVPPSLTLESCAGEKDGERDGEKDGEREKEGEKEREDWEMVGVDAGGCAFV